MIDPGKFAHAKIVEKWGDDGHRACFRFGGYREGIVAELRRFAAAIESGDIVVQKIQTGAVVSAEDYVNQAIMVEYVEIERLPNAAKAPPGRIIELNGWE